MWRFTASIYFSPPPQPSPVRGEGATSSKQNFIHAKLKFAVNWLAVMAICCLHFIPQAVAHETVQLHPDAQHAEIYDKIWFLLDDSRARRRRYLMPYSISHMFCPS